MGQGVLAAAAQGFLAWQQFRVRGTSGCPAMRGVWSGNEGRAPLEPADNNSRAEQEIGGKERQGGAGWGSG